MATTLVRLPAKLLGMARLRTTSRPTLARNLDFLRKLGPDKPSRRKLAERAGLVPQTVNNIYRPDGPSPTLDTLDKLASVNGLETWMLLLPNLPSLIGHRRQLGRLIERYAGSDEAGQRLIDEVAERAAGYKAENSVNSEE